MLTTFYPPYNFGGDGVFVQRLTNALARRGHEIHVIHDLDAFALLTDHMPRQVNSHHPNVTLYPLSTRGIGPVDLFISHQLGKPVVKRRQLKTILENSGFDVIHYHNISLLGGPEILSYGQAVKLCTMHDYWFVCPMHVLWRYNRERCTQRTCLTCTIAGRRPPQLWRYLGMIEHAVRHVDAFISPSNFSREIHAANGFPAAIRRIPHFLPDSEVERAGTSIPGFKHPRPYFVFAGRLEKIKGVQVLLEVFRHYHHADLLIAGKGNYESTLREMAADLPHVHFLGFLDHDQLRSLYSGAIATLVPSLCNETFGWPTLESLMMQTPSIVNQVGALPEVVDLTHGGMVYRDKNELIQAMEVLRTNPEQRNKLGQQGYQACKTIFTEGYHLEMYYSLIDELAGKRRSEGMV